jgi:diguanylate cyclase (GGDEF)-like protein
MKGYARALPLTTGGTVCLGDVVRVAEKVGISARGTHWFLFWVLALPGFVFLLWQLRHSSYTAEPLLNNYLEIVGGLLAFTFAANALVGFRGTHDHVPLILAFGFVLCGIIETGSGLATYHTFSSVVPGVLGHVSLAWMVSRTLLAALFLSALAVEQRMPVARDAGREVAGAALVVGIVAYLTSAAYFAIPAEATVHPGALMTRPWDLLPAALFGAAAVGFWRRLGEADATLDHALCVAAVLNVACHLIATQSQSLNDASFVWAQFLKVTSYAVVLAGALVDNGRLFEQVSHLASSDPLTGLANYRRLLEVLETEIQRSRRSQRPFAVVLLDLDGLKQINDRFGHLTGSRALKRLGNLLRVHCRTTDTAARYGGDEFALVLPEAGHDAAHLVADRIRERLQKDMQGPPISVSAGVAVYPRDGLTIEKLLGAADRALYSMKGQKRNRFRIADIAACL